MTTGKRKSTNQKLRVKAKNSPGQTPCGRNDDRKNKNRQGQGETKSSEVKGRKGAVTIDFKVFARWC